MKINEIRNLGHHKIANISAVIMILFPGVNSIIQAMQQKGNPIESLMGFLILITLVLLIPVYRSARAAATLAFYTPLIVFLFNTIVMILYGGSPYFLIICISACGISCLYSNFSITLAYTTVQTIAIGVLFFMGYPIVGANASVDTAVMGLFFYAFSALVLLILNRTVTVNLNQALIDGNYFKTFLSTTANYLAMVNESNKVIYVSTPLASLAGIENPELAGGRPLIDLFPGRDLKFLTSEMLGQRGLYEKDWEFVLRGQKRYFKAASNTLTGPFKGTLINLNDMTHLAERDEIAAMKDSLKIGLFFMDRSYIIQDNYSRYLDELLSETHLNGKHFIEFLSGSVTSKEQEGIKDYFGMVFDQAFDQPTLEDINPLKELHYVSSKGDKKIFQCEFTAVERGKGEVFLLGTIYDITTKIELQQRLAEEEKKRHEEMRALFELIQVDSIVFNDFMADAEYEFTRIDDILKDDSFNAHEALVEVYQSVHAIKSNAVILGLNTFANNVHVLESEIKKLRERETEVTFDEMLHLTVSLEKLSHEKDGFKDILSKINSFKVGGAEGQKQNEYVLIESLSKAANRAALDLEKKVRLVTTGIDIEAIEKGPRRLIKEVLMQMIRNSVVHGIEMPNERVAKGKSETGVIQLSIKSDGKMVHVKLQDDGQGLNFARIREKALSLNLIKKEDANNKNVLSQAIFLPGFSTAETEGVHAGRGIGLNLVRDRVRDAKGNIKLQSEPGKGTVFYIILPLENTEVKAQAS